MKISEQNDLSHRPASKQANAMQTMRHPQQRAQKRSPLSRNVGRPLTGIVLNLTLPKLHLATYQICEFRHRSTLTRSHGINEHCKFNSIYSCFLCYLISTSSIHCTLYMLLHCLMYKAHTTNIVLIHLDEGHLFMAWALGNMGFD